MKILVEVVIGLVVVVGIAAGFLYIRPQQAMIRVMKADQVLANQRDSIPTTASPSQIAQSIESYCLGLERLDMSDCPTEFKVAFKQHIRAWREARAAVAQQPDSFGDGFLMGALAFLRGESDPGVNRLQGNIQNASRRIRETWDEIEKIAARYGATI